MKILDLKDEDFTSYKKPSMVVAFPTCTFKCGAENCQNYQLQFNKQIEVSQLELTRRYLNNPLTSAIVMAGLEPLDSWVELVGFMFVIRQHTDDDIVIYTGYNKDEIKDKIEEISDMKNIIIKYGRYVPGDEPHYDEVLGIRLASDNQYAERIS